MCGTGSPFFSSNVEWNPFFPYICIPVSLMSMEPVLTHIAHSCFLLESPSLMVVFDYWRDCPDNFLKKCLEQAQVPCYVVASHFHDDHFNPEIFSWKNGEGRAPKYLLSYDTVKKRRVPPDVPDAVLRPGIPYETEGFRLLPFRSTDVGISTAIELSDGTVFFHAGDLNNWYFPDDPGHMRVSLREMEGLYLSVIRSVKESFPRIDHLMFPVDPRLGAETLRGAVQLLERIQVRHFYPMHFWGMMDELYSCLDILSSRFPQTHFHRPSAPF